MTKLPPNLDQDDCPKCGRIFGVADEFCQSCGFDPVNNEADWEEYEKHLARKKEARDGNNRGS